MGISSSGGKLTNHIVIYQSWNKDISTTGKWMNKFFHWKKPKSGVEDSNKGIQPPKKTGVNAEDSLHQPQITGVKQGSATIARKKWLAIDLKISKTIPGDFNRWKFLRPVGISCAATNLGYQGANIYLSRDPQGRILGKMTRSNLIGLVRDLEQAVKDGWSIVTWNGLGFDFDILAEESGCWEICRDLALNHYDIMYHFFCLKGYALGLDKAARGMGLPGIQTDLTSELAPLAWRQGRYEEVLDINSQNVRCTLEMADLISEKQYIAWTSNSGQYQQVRFPGGLLPVWKANELTEPDTGWMSNPRSRNEFMGWTDEKFKPLNIPKEKATPLKAPIIIEAPKEIHQPRRKTKPKSKSVSADEINLILTDNDFCNSLDNLTDEFDDIFDDSKIIDDNWRRILSEPDIQCTCSICMGAPNESPQFIGLFEPEENMDPYDYYDE